MLKYKEKKFCFEKLWSFIWWGHIIPHYLALEVCKLKEKLSSPPAILNFTFRISIALDCCCCSVTQLCLTLCYPIDCSMPGFPVLHHLQELAQTQVCWVGDPSSHLVLCLPLLLPLIFLSIRIFSSELALNVRWPKYWRFSFSVSPSSEYSGL